MITTFKPIHFDGSVCYMCEREMYIKWRVTNKIWDRVVCMSSLDGKKICLECFLKLAGDDINKLKLKHFEYLHIGQIDIIKDINL